MRQLVPRGQTVPQVPQLFGSKLVIVQAVPQSVEPVGHAQRPMLHVWKVPHRVPQAPQFVVLVCVFTQVPPQSVWPVGHAQRPI